MVKTVLDAENSVQWIEERAEDGKVRIVVDNSPFHPDNKLVSFGMCELDENDNQLPVDYLFFYHNEADGIDPVASAKKLQAQLDKTTLLIGHNIKHDLLWLFESGFKYDGLVYDTMIGEYVLARGLKLPLSLSESCIRRMVANKKAELVEQYWKDKIGFEAMPRAIVEEYGIADIVSTAELYAAQQAIYSTERNRSLVKTRDMMNEFCLVLTDMERNGIFIDRTELGRVEEEYLAEQAKLTARAQELVYEVMGDTPINMGSSEQMSMVVYGRKVLDKARWVELFNIGTDDRGKKKRRPRMSMKQFGDTIRRNTVRLRKTKATQCPDCLGKGRYNKFKKNGEPHSKDYKCKCCNGTGIVYTDLADYAGFGCIPTSIEDASDGGFATNKNVLGRLAEDARIKGNAKAEEFLRIIIRLNAIDTYINSFCGGIKRHTGYDNILHCHFNQCVTATGRLSSSDPNFQNMPRGGTFPIRRCVVSRFEGGSILETDYSTLEFSCAAHLANDPDGIAMVLNKEDAHIRTSNCLTEAGQPTNRQNSKSHTFKPLYGGMSGTEAEQTYYRKFITEFHPRIGVWHEELQNEAIRTKRVRLPTGREYAFPSAERTQWGGSTFATQIKNYPVQGFATADIVPIANIRIWRLLRASGLKSIMVNTVHDSIVADVYPGEEKAVLEIFVAGMLGVKEEMLQRYGIELLVPLRCEVKNGTNWLTGQVVYPLKEAA